MKLSIAAVSSFVAAAVAASLPEAFTLVAEGGKTVLTDGSNAIVGGDTNKNDILVFHGGSQNTQVTYTAQGQTPTGWQNLYVIENADEPIALTVPHSGATPQGASMTGFGVNEQNQFTFNGQAAFGIEGQKVHYLGIGAGQKTPLTVKECKGC